MPIINGTSGNDTLTGTIDDDEINGFAGNDTIDGGDGNDALDGGTGADTLRGAAGDDFYIVDNAADNLVENYNAGYDVVWTTVTFTLGANLEDLVLKGTAAINGTGNNLANWLLGNDAANTLVGGEGHDSLNGAGGADVLDGGYGDDTYYVGQSGDTVVEAEFAGADLVISSVSYTLGDHVENLYLADNAAINGTGNALDNSIVGNDSSNVLDGGEGHDNLIGEGGNDTIRGGSGFDTAHYTYASGSVQVDLSAGTSSGADGTDQLDSIEHVIGSAFGDVLRGDAGPNRLVGMGGNDTLDGRSGYDGMEGGAGDDVYFVDNFSDNVVELPGEGHDRIFASDSYQMEEGEEVEVIELTGSADLLLWGNGFDNVLIGNSGSNQFWGLDGEDTLYGNGGNDWLNGVDSWDEQIDRLYGGPGADVYEVNSMADVTIEYAGEGVDTVQFVGNESYTLRANIENLRAFGIAPVVKGNELANVITGSGYANKLYGFDGNDRLYGEDGNDTLDGGAGIDRMYGGTGNDTYIVRDSTDYAYENAGEGTDRVNSSVTQTLRVNVENLYLTGTANTSGTGNALANVVNGNTGANRLSGLDGDDRLYGRDGNDRLDGGAGIDRLYGGLGNDTYIVSDTTDYAYENAAEGTDSVYSSVSHALRANIERLYLTGTAATNGTGNDLANVMVGNSAGNLLSGLGGNDLIKAAGGDDTVNGGDGKDVLAGGTGADSFRFDTALSASSNVDRLTDFSVVDDTIQLDRSIFTALSVGALSAAAFHSGTAAQDADDRIIYDSATGRIYYDADGSGAGAQVLFAQVNAGAALTNSDFIIVA